MAPWHLELGRIDRHQLTIEHPDRPDGALVLCFDPPLGACGDSAGLAPARIALVQAGMHQELSPWRSPVRALTLPWPRAPLDDLWLALHTAAGRSWFELPYGLCAAPGAHHAAPQLGPPRAPPEVGADDAVLPWHALRLALGRARGWQLTAIIRQSRPGELELFARRAEPGVPPPISLDATLGSRPLELVPLDARTDEPAGPAPLHVARYRFAPPPLGARTYVRLTARSGRAVFELQLPTSLTDPGHRSIGSRPRSLTP